MRIVTMTLAAFLAIGAAQEKQEKRQMKDRVWMEGKIVCIGCTLAKEFGVDAQCTRHAKHAQGLLDGEGTLWTFVDNARGHCVITERKFREKTVRVHGWKYPKHRYIEFWRFQLRKGEKWIDWDYCKT